MAPGLLIVDSFFLGLQPGPIEANIKIVDIFLEIDLHLNIAILNKILFNSLFILAKPNIISKSNKLLKFYYISNKLIIKKIPKTAKFNP